MDMDIEELSTENDVFDEEAALESLPKNREGLAKLLTYLHAFDSLPAWCYLFEEYGQILTQKEHARLKQQALAIFDRSMLCDFLPDVFARENDTGPVQNTQFSSKLQDYFMDGMK